MARTELMRTKYLIVGNSAGGIGAVEAIREVDKMGSITIISDEPYPTYSRPLISKYLTKERTLDGMLFRPLGFYSRNNITSLLGRMVKRLDLESYTVELEDGDAFAEVMSVGPGAVDRAAGLFDHGFVPGVDLDPVAQSFDGYVGDFLHPGGDLFGGNVETGEHCGIFVDDFGYRSRIATHEATDDEHGRAKHLLELLHIR